MAWTRPGTEREVRSLDGRRWFVRTAAVGVPDPIGGLIGLVGFLVGGLYHLLWHRGEWRVEVRERPDLGWQALRGSSGFPPLYELGIYDRNEAEARCAATTRDLETGQWYPESADA